MGITVMVVTTQELLTHEIESAVSYLDKVHKLRFIVVHLITVYESY